MTSRRVARAEWLKDEGTLAASRAASEVMVVTAEAAMLEDSDVALVNGLGAAHFVETFWWKGSIKMAALSRSGRDVEFAGSVRGPSSVGEVVECGVGVVGVEVFAGEVAVLWPDLDDRTVVGRVVVGE
jgi:hypothetical protein